MSEGDPEDPASPLDDLGARIADQRRARAQADQARNDGAAKGGQMGAALRAGTDMVAGVLVGALLGWGADRLFGTSPLFLMLFLLLGTAGGILNAMRSARRMSNDDRDETP